MGCKRKGSRTVHTYTVVLNKVRFMKINICTHFIGCIELHAALFSYILQRAAAGITGHPAMVQFIRLVLVCEVPWGLTARWATNCPGLRKGNVYPVGNGVV